LVSKLTSVTLHPAVDTGYRYTYGLFISPPNPRNTLYAVNNYYNKKLYYYYEKKIFFISFEKIASQGKNVLKH